jgi:hypothetical protein
VPVTQVCNLSYSGGRDQEDCSSKPAWAHSSWDHILKKKKSQKKGWWSGSNKSAWLESMRPWIQIPVPPPNNNNKKPSSFARRNAYNPSTQEAEEGESQASLGYIMRSWLRKTNCKSWWAGPNIALIVEIFFFKTDVYITCNQKFFYSFELMEWLKW